MAALESELTLVTREMNCHLRQHFREQARLLTSVKGVADITAATLLPFPSARAYAGRTSPRISART